MPPPLQEACSAAAVLKVMTIVGTRPEIIRLSRVIALLDKTVDHTLVHTGQNYDYELNQIFFDELDLRPPDYLLNVDTSSLGRVLGETSDRRRKGANRSPSGRRAGTR